MKIEKNILISIEDSDVKNGVLTIPKRVHTIADKVIVNNKNLIKFIALGVTTMGNYNFYECNALVSFEAPLTTIGNYNFRYCNALVSFEAPLTTIGNDNFRYCNALVSFEAPLTTMGNYNFRYCNALVSFEAPLTTMGNYNFYECNALVSFEAPLTTMGNYNFYECNALVSFSIKNKKITLKCADSIPFVIDSEKTTKGIKIFVGGNLLRIENKKVILENCFLSEKDGFFAHGKDLKTSIRDLQFKIVSEKLKKEPILPYTELNVMYYRTVTGACDFGCRSWLSNHKFNFFVENIGTSNEATILADENGNETHFLAKDILPILAKDNPYGFEKLRTLIDWEF
jgi:hypothetical protein